MKMPSRKRAKTGKDAVGTESDVTKEKKAKTATGSAGFQLAIEHWDSDKSARPLMLLLKTSRFYNQDDKVFKRKALAIVEDLRQQFGEIEVELNPSAPRRGSFEIVLVRDGQEDVTVWTGLKKGPPRKLKFPESAVVVKEISKALKDV